MLSPVPLEPNAAGSDLGPAKAGFSTSVHALQDVTGDGYIDAIAWDSRALPEGGAIEETWWAVFPGAGGEDDQRKEKPGFHRR